MTAKAHTPHPLAGVIGDITEDPEPVAAPSIAGNSFRVTKTTLGARSAWAGSEASVSFTATIFTTVGDPHDAVLTIKRVYRVDPEDALADETECELNMRPAELHALIATLQQLRDLAQMHGTIGAQMATANDGR